MQSPSFCLPAQLPSTLAHFPVVVGLGSKAALGRLPPLLRQTVKTSRGGLRGAEERWGMNETQYGPSSQTGRWYVLVLTVVAAVAMIWIISEEAGSRAEPPALVATER